LAGSTAVFAGGFFDIAIATESDLRKLVDDMLATAGSRHGDGPAFAELLLGAGMDVPERDRVLELVDVKGAETVPASALAGFATSWLKAQKRPGPKRPVEDERDSAGSNARQKLKELVRLAVANDLVGFGSLLRASDVNSFQIWEAIMPE
jgi:hypothetical protein